MMRTAYDEGYLRVNLNSTYQDNTETQDTPYYSHPTISNFEQVVNSIFTEDEKVSLFNGNGASLNVDIAENTDTVAANAKKEIDNKFGYKALSYFDFTIIKTVDASSSVVERTDKPLEVSIRVPENCKKSGRKLCVLRDHNGEVEVLENISNDPDIITFRTDRFSEYAIAYQAIDFNLIMGLLLGLTLTALIIAIFCVINLLRSRRA